MKLSNEGNGVKILEDSSKRHIILFIYFSVSCLQTSLLLLLTRIRCTIQRIRSRRTYNT
jgi:hypothetical protein